MFKGLGDRIRTRLGRRMAAPGRNSAERVVWGLLGPIERAVERLRGRVGRNYAAGANLPILLDRWTLRGMYATLAVWSVCLWVLGVEGMGWCWSASVELAAMELAALAVALAVPNYAANLIFSVSARLRSAAAMAAQMALAGPGPAPYGHPRGLLRLLALAAVACCVGGLATTEAIRLFPVALAALAREFIAPAWAWMGIRLAYGWLAMLPLGLAAGALALVGSALRRYGPSDPYRLVTRDILWSAAAGWVLAATLWWAGMDLRGVALACSAVMLAWAGLTVSRRSSGVRPAGLGGPFAPARPHGRRRWLNLCEWAALGWIVTLQCRALRDVQGGWPWPWLWMALTAALLAGATRRLDRRPLPGRALEAGASATGAMLVAAMQIALLALAAAGAPLWWAWTALAVAGQAPFAALAAVALSRRRRLFAKAGFPARFWLADAAGGLAVGALAAVGTLGLPGGAVVLAVTALTLVGGTILTGGGRRKAELSGRMRWAGVGAAVILAAALICSGLARAGRGLLGEKVAVGASLTAVGGPDGRVSVLGGGPGGGRRQADGGDAWLTKLADQAVKARGGRWWLVAGCGNVPTATDMDLPPQVSFPDAACGRLMAWPDGALDGGQFGRQLAVQVPGLDGILISGLPADHPDSWCLFSQETLGRCRDLLADGGVLIVRTRVDRRGIARLLAVAETFRSVAADATAAVVLGETHAEALLLAGGGSAIEAAWGSAAPRTPRPLSGAIVPLGRLIPPSVKPRAITVRSPGRAATEEPASPSELWRAVAERLQIFPR